MRVLVVEDEALIQMLVCDLLEDAGHDCVAVNDAEAALALLDRTQYRPEVLVTDYNLGPGLDGQALGRQVQALLPALPTVFVTGNPDCFSDYRFEAWERLVPKPFSAEVLYAAIEAVRPAAERTAGGGRIDIRAALFRLVTGPVRLLSGGETFA